MKMEMRLEAATASLEKRDRSRLHFLPFDAAFDRLVNVILRDGGADDGMHLRRQVTR
jgi:hypothetical protein